MSTIVGEVPVQHLDRDLAPGPAVLAGVDLAHPAGAEQALHHVGVRQRPPAVLPDPHRLLRAELLAEEADGDLLEAHAGDRPVRQHEGQRGRHGLHDHRVELAGPDPVDVVDTLDGDRLRTERTHVLGDHHRPVAADHEQERGQADPEVEGEPVDEDQHHREGEHVRADRPVDPRRHHGQEHLEDHAHPGQPAHRRHREPAPPDPQAGGDVDALDDHLEREQPPVDGLVDLHRVEGRRREQALQHQQADRDEAELAGEAPELGAQRLLEPRQHRPQPAARTQRPVRPSRGGHLGHSARCYHRLHA
jgi:hypothetical protein